MSITKTKEYTGYSESGLEEAIQNALTQAENYQQVKVIETRSSHNSDDKRQFQVTLATVD